MLDLTFYKNKKVLVTGHTGFKGSWLVEFLNVLEADVYGYALKPQDVSLYSQCNIENKCHSYYGDIRDFDYLLKTFNETKPEIVFHLAAQPLVLESYENPRYTYETNVMGTVNVLECIRNTNSVISFVNVTTDKVYKNIDNKTYKEDDELDGYDPYANSKSCSELISNTYRRCYFKDKLPISTCRSGNVIGGGDFNKNRIMSDCLKAYLNDEDIIIRNPNSNRPYQHVLEALYIYLLVGQKQVEDIMFVSSYNIGPDKDEIVDNKTLVEMFINNIYTKTNKKINYKIFNNDGPHEAKQLVLDNNKIKEMFGYKCRYDLKKAVHELSNYAIAYKEKKLNEDYLQEEIEKYLNI